MIMKKLLKKYFYYSLDNDFKPVQTSTFVLGIFALLLFFSFGFKMLNCYFLKQNSILANLNTIDIVNEINNIRKSYGLEPLTINPKLDVAAMLKAEDMISNDYFNHNSPEGKTPWFWFNAVNYNYKYAGENLALNFWNNKETVQAWLNSPSHKDNILSPNYQETGVAILSGTTSTTKESKTIIVQLFGSENISKQSVIAYKVEPIATTTTTTSLITTTTTIEIKPLAQINRVEIDETIPKEPEEILISSNDEIRKNIAKIINQNSVEKTSVKGFIGYNLTKDLINQSWIKTFDNSMGIGLLFLGIFGIINIYNNNQIKVEFKRKLLAKNFLIILIGVGLFTSNFIIGISNVRTPIF